MSLSEKIWEDNSIGVADVKEFIKLLEEFIEDKTLQRKGLPDRVVFLDFEFEEFLKDNLGDLK